VYRRVTIRRGAALNASTLRRSRTQPPFVIRVVVLVVVMVAAQGLPSVTRTRAATAARAPRSAPLTPRLFPGASYATGAQATSVAFADFDGNGQPDAAVSNAFGSVSLLAGNSDGTFQTAIDIPTVGGCGTLAVADFNHDGHPDIAVVNSVSQNNLSVFLGRGDGTFQPAMSFNLTSNRSRTLAVGDVNGDGNADIVVGDGDFGGLHVLLGNGDGTFKAAISYVVDDATNSVTIADLNGDGRPDVVVGRAHTDVQVWVGNGDGTFNETGTFLTGGTPFGVTVGDLNGDGVPDLAVANLNSNNVAVLVGEGDATFRAAVNYNVGGAPTFVAVGDLNGDAKPDLAVTNSGSNTVSVLLGAGGGTFGPSTSYSAGSSPYSLAIRDLDGDGRPDLAVVASGAGLVTLFGRGHGTFEAAALYSAGVNTASRTLAVGDLNGDGHPDLAVVNRAGFDHVSILLGRADGTFDAPVNYLGGSFPQSVAVGDINGDGHPDLLVANAFRQNGDTVGLVVLLGNGDGTFNTSPVTQLAGQDLRASAVADVNGDGSNDIVVAEGTRQVAVLVNNGDGIFKAPAEIPTNGLPQSVAVADLNGDGHPDIVAPSIDDDGVAVLLGNGDGTFKPPVDHSGGAGERNVAIGDLNSDGVPDLAIANSDGHVTLLLGIGDGTFKAANTFAAGSGTWSVAVGDLSGDHIPDLAVANADGNDIGVLLGNRDGTYQKPLHFAVGAGPHSVAIADLDGDGNRDLVATNAGAEDVAVSVLLSLLPPATGTPTLNLQLSGPHAVTINNRHYTPDPFTITGTVRNSGTVAANDVNVTLSLPEGLELASNPGTQAVGLIGPGARGQRSWQVRATGSSVDSTLHYFMTAASSNATASPVAGQVAVPGLFSVRTFTPTKAGNAGPVTITILGSGFNQGTIAKLGGITATTIKPISTTRIDATFDVTALAAGTYPVVVDNFDGTHASFPSPMTIVDGGGGLLDVELIVPPAIRVGVHQPLTKVPFLIIASNTGLVDLQHPTFDLDVSDTNGQTTTTGQPIDASQGVTVPFGSLTPAFVPNVQAGQTVVVNALAEVSATAQAALTVPKPGALAGPVECVSFYVVCRERFQNAVTNWNNVQAARDLVVGDIGLLYATCITAYSINALLGLIALQFPKAGALFLALIPTLDLHLPSCRPEIDELYRDYQSWTVAWANFDIAWSSYSKCLEGQNVPALPQLPSRIVLPVQAALDVEISLMYLAVGATLWPYLVPSITSLPRPNLAPHPPDPPKKSVKTSCSVGSADPNYKQGPAGFGEGRFVLPSSVLDYAVKFENDPTVATAPAQHVTVTDHVDSAKVDMSKLALGPIGFGSTTLIPPPGSQQYATDVDLRPGKLLVVRVNAAVDPIKGVLTWNFESLDPATGLPTTDPLAGFLPPNVSAPDGEGFVTYTAPLLAAQMTGTTVGGAATVVFDQNPPMDTPAWINTVDAGPPASAVQPLAPATSNESFPVSWSGSDDASGVARFNVYVSDDGGPFAPWQTETAATSATFDGVDGHTYRFFSTAIDNVGNVEAVKQVAEASTRVVTRKSMTMVAVTSGALSVGGNIHDTSTLLGGVAPTGTITFSLFGPDNTTCKGTAIFSTTATVTGGGSYISAPFTTTTAGAYRFVAAYSGDADNAKLTSACGDPNQTVSVSPPARLLTHASAGVAAGGRITDTATLSGGVRPSGLVTFTLFGPDNAACRGTPIFTSTVAVAGDGDYHSAPFVANLAGTYRFVAVYSGDAANAGATSACGAAKEAVIVTKASPVLATRASPPIRVGGAITDTATVSGGANPAATITFTVFGPDDATCASPQVFTSITAVNGNGSYTSGPFRATRAGLYRFVASYNGDLNNNAAVTACADANETVMVTKASPTLTTEASPPVLLGGTIVDTATVSDGYAATGTITFLVFGPNDPTCRGTALVTSTRTVAGNGIYTSPPFTVTTPGTYRYETSYRGDTNNNAVPIAGCGTPSESVAASCTTTITGNETGGIVTGPGSTCVLNAHITGSIVVSNGETVDIESSTVNGSITANKAAIVRMCGTSTSSVSVHNSTGFVLVGDAAHGCAPNTLSGSLVVTNNTGGVDVIGNRVSGAVAMSGNTGTGPFG
jgi:uncharacterized repeat protein (TIGR01451 family)